jgi:Helicase HerA, central domain
MIHFIDQLVAAIWNRLRRWARGARQETRSLDLGSRVVDGQVTRWHVGLSSTRRAMHIAVLGKTGTGKSSFLRYLSQQDIEADRGFLYFDLHGDATPFLLQAISTRERRLHRHLSDKLIVIEPADPIYSVGFNPLEQETTDFVRIAEFAAVLKLRWGLDHFGARTDELLRNSLYVLSANNLTLLELAPLLTHVGFRAACLKNVPNFEVRQYFEARFDQTSEAMQATMREPILNKTSAFTADPHFRHIVGQAHSTFSIREAMDEGYWVLVNLPKGRLGEQALTLGSLLFTMVKNALFTREKRSLYTVYCDEIQNLVAYGSGIDTVLSEARKFGVSVVSANQFLEQYPAEMRAAILAVGTHVFFQLSSMDSAQVSQALDGGKSLAERLKNLPQRRCIVKSASDRWTEVEVPTVREAKVDYTDLLNRSRLTRGRVRAHIERDIAARQSSIGRSADEVLHEWE